jgi:IS30 family transposase
LGGRPDHRPQNLSAIGTLVERTTNYTMLLHLPDGYTPELVRDGLAAKIKTLPDVLRASLTWDQGPEMGKWKQVAIDADIDIYFCDPHAPWQRATNENTNGLLRQYFPKSSDLSAHSIEDLDWIAAELNDRPRKRLGFKKPIEQIGSLAVALTARIRRPGFGTAAVDGGTPSSPMRREDPLPWQ